MSNNKKTTQFWMIALVILAMIIFGITLNSCDNEEITEEKKQEYEIVVEIKGEVLFPDIYKLPEGARVSDLIAIAGGFTSTADDKNVNLAAKLEDGMIILINKNVDILNKVNINQATYDELMKLDGMTKTRANNIIKHREDNGLFNSINELLELKIITDEIFEKIKEFITI